MTRKQDDEILASLRAALPRDGADCAAATRRLRRRLWARDFALWLAALWRAVASLLLPWMARPGLAAHVARKGGK